MRNKGGGFIVRDSGEDVFVLCGEIRSAGFEALRSVRGAGGFEIVDGPNGLEEARFVLL